MADSLDKRRFRRTRLKRAMEPIIAMFGCTQMGAADAIKGVINQNNQLQAEVARKDELLQSLREGTDKITKDKDAVIDTLRDMITERDAEIDRLKTAIDTRIDTEARQDEKIEALEENLNVTANELAVLKESKSIQEG